MKIHRTAAGSFALILARSILLAQSNPVSLAYQVTHVDHASPSISSDGKRMVYAAVIAGKEQLFTMNLDGSDSAQITKDVIDHNNPIWSPDGRRIAFSAEDGEHISIYAIDADGRNPERITPDDGQKYIHPDW